MDLLFLFEWLDTSFIASLSKAYGGVFAVVQMFHLLAMAMLGGMVMLGDLRLLGVLMKEVPAETVAEQTDKWFGIALIAIVVSGIFMSSAVAIKLYYNEMFWAKMIGLAFGVFFYYAIRRPLLRLDHATLNPWSLRLTAIASLTVWFSVAACGRWIGFS